MKKTIYFYSNIVAWALILLLIGNFVFGWTPPSATPPYENVSLGSSQWTTSDSNIYYNTGNIGIGTTGPKNKLDIEGGAVIGATYSGTNTAPSNGLLVEGNTTIGTTGPGEKLEVAGAIKIGTAIGTADGTIRWTGSDFEGRKSGSWVSLTPTGGVGTSTDPGISNVYYNTNYLIDGVAKTGVLQRACYNTGAVELGTTGNFCGDTQGTAVAGDICNSTKAWVDGSLITGNRFACSPGTGDIPKTGQTTDYASTTPQLCGDGGTGGCDDGYYKKGKALSYTDNGNGTITDNNTGLMWKRCTEPDTQTSGCTGTHSTYFWQDAINQCEGLNYAGYTDWRLPNAKELWSIISIEKGNSPYVDHTAFPGTASGRYWTSTTALNDVSGGNDYAFDIYFYQGSMPTDYKELDNYVRCIRG